MSWNANQGLLLAASGGVALALLLTSGDDPALLAREEALLALPGFALALAVLVRPSAVVYLLAGGVLALVPVLLLVSSPRAHVLAPAAGPEFLGATLLLAAFLLAIPGGVLGYFERRGRSPGPGAREILRGSGAALAVALASVLAGVAVTTALSFRDAQQASAERDYDLEADDRVRVTIQGFRFLPDNVVVRAGTTTEILVENRDSVVHTFTYEVQGTTYVHRLLPGTETRFLVLFEGPGVHPLRSDPSAATTGTLTVIPH